MKVCRNTGKNTFGDYSFGEYVVRITRRSGSVTVLLKDPNNRGYGRLSGKTDEVRRLAQGILLATSGDVEPVVITIESGNLQRKSGAQRSGQVGLPHLEGG